MARADSLHMCGVAGRAAYDAGRAADGLLEWAPNLPGLALLLAPVADGRGAAGLPQARAGPVLRRISRSVDDPRALAPGAPEAPAALRMPAARVQIEIAIERALERAAGAALPLASLRGVAAEWGAPFHAPELFSSGSGATVSSRRGSSRSSERRIVRASTCASSS